MKTREVRERIQSMGFEKGVVWCLEALNEQQIQLGRDINELAQLFDKLTDSMQQLTGAMEHAKSAVESLQERQQQEDGLGVNTQALGRDDEDT